MHSFILKLAQVSVIKLVLIMVLFSEILTFIFSYVQSLLLWGHISGDTVMIGAVDALLNSLILAPLLIYIVRFSAASNVRKIELEEELESSRKRLEVIADNVSDVIWAMDRSAIITYVSPSVKTMLGYEPEEVKGKMLADFLSPEAIETTARSIKKSIQGENQGEGNTRSVSYELSHIKKDGSLFWAEVTSTSIRDETGRLTGFLGVTRDINSRKLALERLEKSEENLRATLKTKDVLLQEIHHRVKNNLAIISALLSLQSRHLEDKELRGIFAESQNRIYSMAYVHEQLYINENFETIDFNKYVEGFTTYLIHAFGRDLENTKLVSDIEPIALTLDALIPCGLILNELITNSLKYASVSSGEELKIFISLKRSGNSINLSVGDNGPGLPEGFDASSNSSLGMKIVTQLVNQIEGELEITNSNGAHFKIVFAADHEDETQDHSESPPQEDDEGELKLF
jgi:PAS domain S-box-containing protein